jgi:hypothetical protein
MAPVIANSRKHNAKENVTRIQKSDGWTRAAITRAANVTPSKSVRREIFIVSLTRRTCPQGDYRRSARSWERWEPRHEWDD